jgi:hypothetical protein
MFWGPAQQGSWNQRVTEMEQNRPSHLLGFNEPDISSQSNMSPQDAANLWMQQIHPWGQKGVQLVSPAIAFDLTWMASFLSAIESQGGYVDAIALHWYGKPSDISQLESYVQQAHSQFGKPIWVTEMGVTTASGANANDVLSFVQQITRTFEGYGYVDRFSYFGCFQQSQPIDGFASANNAFFYSQNSLTPLGQWWQSGN